MHTYSRFLRINVGPGNVYCASKGFGCRERCQIRGNYVVLHCEEDKIVKFNYYCACTLNLLLRNVVILQKHPARSQMALSTCSMQVLVGGCTSTNCTWRVNTGSSRACVTHAGGLQNVCFKLMYVVTQHFLQLT